MNSPLKLKLKLPLLLIFSTYPLFSQPTPPDTVYHISRQKIESIMQQEENNARLIQSLNLRNEPPRLHAIPKIPRSQYLVQQTPGER